MQKKLILDSDLLDITLSRLCEQLIENHGSFNDSMDGSNDNGFTRRSLSEGG